MKRKVLDISKAKKYGWVSKTSLDDGFDQTYQEFLKKMNRK
jgi:nucleoside-diphosphate-sugar epimerase